MQRRRSSTPSLLALLALLGCRDKTTSEAGASPSARTYASAAPAPSASTVAPPLPAVRAFLSGDAGMAVLLEDGRVLAKTQRGNRTATASGEVTSFRTDMGSSYAWLERGRPVLWLAEKNGTPLPVCDVQTARDIVLDASRVCLVLDSGALACTDAVAPDCSAIAKPVAKGPYARFLVARSGAAVVVDANGKASEVTFPKDAAHPKPLPGDPTASAFVGFQQAFTRSGGGFRGRAAATCLASKGAYTCFDRTTGKAHPLQSMPEGATQPGLVAKNALCFLRAGQVACEAVDVGLDEDDKNPLPGRALEKMPPLPDGRTGKDWGPYWDGVAVLTTSNEVFTWKLDGRGAPPAAWERVELK